MPKGIPKSGNRLPGSGRRKKYASKLVQKWIPLAVANNLDDVYQLLVNLDKTVTAWEKLCEQKITSPRYEQARKLVSALRVMLDRTGIHTDDIYTNDKHTLEKE
jgi:hypothetical protein